MSTTDLSTTFFHDEMIDLELKVVDSIIACDVDSRWISVLRGLHMDILASFDTAEFPVDVLANRYLTILNEMG